MWAGSTANEAGQLGGVRATNHAGFGLDETSAATSYPAPGAAAAPAAGGATNPPRPPSLPPPLPPAMPYPWDHHHLRHHEEVAKAALVWSPAPEAAHAHVSKPSPNSGSAGTPPTPAQTPVGVGGGSTGGQQQQQHQQHNNNNNHQHPVAPHHHHHHQTHNHHVAHHHGPSASSINNNNNNPPTSSQPQAGLMHWMSVMAEHMTSANPHHHDVHYMWNGVESKMSSSDQSNSTGSSMHQKGGTLDQDGRMEGGVSLSHGPPVVVGQLGSASAANLYGVGGPRSTTSASTSSSSSQSPPIAPIVSSGSTAGGKMSGSTSNGGRKYQCKMCPQVSPFHVESVVCC